MGIQDRDYYPQQRPPFSMGAPRSAVVVLIIINVVIWILDYFTQARVEQYGLHEVIVGRWLSDTMAVSGETLTRPWLWWKFLTYGFAHSPNNLGHVFWNMFGLFVFGRAIEERYGQREFIRLYLALIIAGGVVWAIINQLQGGHPGDLVYGASGAVVGIVILFALNYPHRTLLLFFVLPMPAWVLGVVIVVLDLYGALANMAIRGGSNVAFSVHLAGAAFAFLYFRFGWNFGRLVEGRLSLSMFRRRPRLQIHDPDRDSGSDLSKEVDRILEKISREGEASLTRKERRTLETASRQYQRKRRQ